MNGKKQELLRQLPKIDEILSALGKKGISTDVPHAVVVDICRRVVDESRRALIASADKEVISFPSREQAAEEVTRRIRRLREYSLRRVVNATGIILHTNLGRAPLSREAIDRVVDVSSGYSNLEYDLGEGKRGIRYDHVRDVLCALTGAEDALVVNNNAAAVLLVLNTLSEDRETIISRGELIEIGGSFRIPEVMEKSGAVLREVGTTNRTHLFDYEHAIGENTALILKVHTSNFRTVGFTEDVDLSRLVALGRERQLPVADDLGSGCFVDLQSVGFQREPTVQEVVRTGVDVVTFSGDKLLGGPQAGIIVGREEYLSRIKKNPLNRALRIDKMTLAALEATVKHYFAEDRVTRRIGILRALTESPGDVRRRGEYLLARLRDRDLPGLTVTLKTGTSLSGGGSLPTQEIKTTLIALTASRLSASRFERVLRDCEVPIIARIAEGDVLLDMRTVSEEELPVVERGLETIFSPDTRDDRPPSHL